MIIEVKKGTQAHEVNNKLFISKQCFVGPNWILQGGHAQFVGIVMASTLDFVSNCSGSSHGQGTVSCSWARHFTLGRSGLP